MARHSDPDDGSFARSLLRAFLGGVGALILTAGVTGVLAQTGAIGSSNDSPAVVTEAPAASPSPTAEPTPTPSEPDPFATDPEAFEIPAAGDSEEPTEAGAGAFDPGDVSVQVLDGVGDLVHAQDAADVLRDLGYEVINLDAAAIEYPETTIIFTEGHRDDAEALMAHDPRFAKIAPNTDLTAPADLHIVVGTDWPDPG